MKQMSTFRIGKTTTLFALILSTVFMIKCSVEQPIDEPLEKEKGDIEVKLRITVPEMNPALLGTRASEISDIYVMTFETTPPHYMKDAPQECLIENAGTPTESYYVATLKASAAPRLVVIVANAGSILSTYSCTPLLDDGSNSAVATKLADVKLLETSQLAFTSPYITEQPELAPMVGEVTIPNLRNGMVITDFDGTTHKEVVLTRATARFTIKTIPSISLTDFEIVGASMGNAPRTGFLFPQSAIALSSSLYAYSASPPFTPLVGAVGGGR